MGTEIVFVLIYPVAALCLVAAVFFWFKIAPSEMLVLGGTVRAYLSLAVGFGISIVGLVVLSYLNSAATFTSLIQQGYYTEAQRALYLPRRIVGDAVLNMVLVLPAISFVVVPLTVRLIEKNRLTLGWIARYILAGWLALSLFGWLLSARTMVDPFTLIYAMGYTAIPVVIYGLPIPFIALLFLRNTWKL